MDRTQNFLQFLRIFSKGPAVCHNLIFDLSLWTAYTDTCKLNILSFFTLPDLLDCLICTRNAMSIILLQVMGEQDRLIDLY